MRYILTHFTLTLPCQDVLVYNAGSPQLSYICQNYIYIYINQEMNPADFGDILFLSAVSEEQARLIENAGAL